MPTFSTTPRGGSSTRGGSFSTAPRGASAAPTPGLTSALGIRNPTPGLRGNLSKPGQLPGPLNMVLRAANISNLAIGDAIQHPEHIIHGGPSFSDLYHQRKGESIGNALEQRGVLDAIPNKYGLRSTAKFVADVGLDPTTYLSLGGAGALRGVGRAASERLAAEALAGRVSLHSTARTAAEVALERQAVPRALSVGVQLPFTRAKRVVLFETQAVPRILDRITAKIPGRDALARAYAEISPRRGADPIIHAIGNDVRNSVNVGKREIDNLAGGFQKQLDKALKAGGIGRVPGYRAVSLAVEDPKLYQQLPDALRPFADELKTHLDAFHVAEQAAGVEKATVPHYLPHRLLNDAERRKFDIHFGPQGAYLDNPFFVKARTFDTIPQGEALGFKFELNPARLLQVRGHVSLDAIGKKALDDTVAQFRGLRQGPKPLPDVAGALARSDAERARLGELSSRVDTGPAAAAAQQARVAEKEARVRLKAARRTGDPQAVAEARAHLERTIAEGRASAQQVAAEQAATALPRYQQLGRDLTATRATLPRPSAGRYTLPRTQAEQIRILRGKANEAERQAAALEAAHAAQVRDAARQLRDSHVPEGRRNYGALGNRGDASSAYRQGARPGEKGMYAFNGGNDNSWHYINGRRKTLGQYEQDVLAYLRGESSLPLGDIIGHVPDSLGRAIDRAEQLRALARDHRQAIQVLRSKPEDIFAAGPADIARAQEHIDQSIRPRVMDARARRARNAQPTGPLVDLPGATAAQRARARRLFTPEGPTLAATREAVRTEAERAVEQAIARSDQAVAKAERRLAKAQKAGSKPAIRNAKAQLARAEATRDKARLALERDRASYVGTPRQIAAQAKRTLKADKNLATVEQRAAKVASANEKLATRPGKEITREEWKALGEEWQVLGSKYLKSVKVDAATRRSLEIEYAKISPILTTPEGLGALINFAHVLTARWKALALANPGFHIRNAMDDAFRAFLAGGRNPKSYTDAYRILTGKGEGIRVLIDGKVFDGPAIKRLSEGLGLSGSGFSGEVTRGLSETEGMVRKATSHVRAPGTGAVAQTSRKVGDIRESASRLGTFLERVKAGDSAYEAARVAREYHLDYGDVGRLVEHARRFWLPFVTYTAKAAPLMARHFLKRPGTFATIDKAFTALNDAGGAPDLSTLPTGARSSFAVPLPGMLRRALGASPGNPILYNPERTFGFGTFNTLDPTQFQQQGLGLLNTFAKTAIEVPTGYRFYYAGQTAKRVRAPFLVQQAARLPGVGALLDYGPKHYSYGNQTVPGYGAVQDSLLQLFPPFGVAGRLTPAEGAPTVAPAIGSWLTGVRLAPYDLQRARFYSQKNKNR